MAPESARLPRGNHAGIREGRGPSFPAGSKTGIPCGMPAAAQRPKFSSATLGAGADCGRLARRNDLVFPVWFRLSALADVDSALEEGAVFNRDAGRDDVAGERSVAANVDAVAGRQ